MLINWVQPLAIPGNEKVLKWLAFQAEPPAPNGMEFHGYELHAHPDLIEPGVFDRLVSDPVSYVAAYGVPALAHPNGLIFAFAYGTHYVYFRDVQINGPEVIDRLGPTWQGLNVWFPPSWESKGISERTTESQDQWMVRIRKIASEAYERAAARSNV
jgi:hypothetical protein